MAHRGLNVAAPAAGALAGARQQNPAVEIEVYYEGWSLVVWL